MHVIEQTPSLLFTKWATLYSGCDGGDIGSPSNRSVWFCGIEWGGGHAANVDVLNSMFSQDVSVPAVGYDEWKENLAYIFNWQALKLLAVIDGRQLCDYKSFAEEAKPFTVGSNGYFKMNLYPLAFRNTSHKHWSSEFAQATGFGKKEGYLDWIKARRFPAMRSWVEKHMPKVIICTGITYMADFQSAFGDDGMEFTSELIDDRLLRHGINKQGTLVVAIPFMVNRNGLTKNVTIQKFGERIRELLLQQTHLAGR